MEHPHDGILFSNKKNELSNHKRQGLRCILLNERSHFEKATQYRVQIVLHSGKGKIQRKISKLCGCWGLKELKVLNT